MNQVMSLEYFMKYVNWRRANRLNRLNEGQIRRIREAEAYYFSKGLVKYDAHGHLSLAKDILNEARS